MFVKIVQLKIHLIWKDGKQIKNSGLLTKTPMLIAVFEKTPELILIRNNPLFFEAFRFQPKMIFLDDFAPDIFKPLFNPLI